jgi:outer membrane immunogenic protein
MKRIVLASAALFAFVVTQPALAADAPIYKAPPAALFNWSGFYAGIVGGGGWGDSEQIAPGPVSTGSFDISGGVLGGTVGFNWQTAALVFGIEGDYSAANIRGSTTAVCGVACTTDLRSLGTVRGRLGYTAGRFMPYLTAGYAFGDLRRGFGATSGNATADGWAGGVGLEALLAPNWSVKAEYLYVDLGRTNVPIGGFPTTVDFQAHLLRVGLNYRFW